MGCYVARKGAKKKDGTHGHWYIVHECNFRTINGKKVKDCPTVPKEEAIKLGWKWEWSSDEAKRWASMVNKGNHNKKWDEERLKRDAALRAEKKELDSYLPALYLESFEKELERNVHYVNAEVPMHWRYAKRIIVSLQLDPFTWSTPMNRENLRHPSRLSMVPISKTVESNQGKCVDRLVTLQEKTLYKERRAPYRGHTGENTQCSIVENKNAHASAP